MGTLEIIMLGIGLSMDAVAVTITNVLGYKCLSKKQKLSMPIAFGLFQGLMPMIGYYAGSLFSEFISRYAGLVTLLVLGYIGGNMIKESFEKDECECCGERDTRYTFKVLFFQAVATSIDAFAVGVSFAALRVNVLFASTIIAISTAFLCFIALYVGKKFGEVLGERAQLLGGMILVLIGIKAMF
ncbi:MAG: manganese efflux pump [Erysipelotrichaceae bacterium]|nr:manganese efflux pump [Erysipelotrichaceae bacterium]MBR3694179.1 manganese efflux pump [Erysipelotrichales bacterium]